MLDRHHRRRRGGVAAAAVVVWGCWSLCVSPWRSQVPTAWEPQKRPTASRTNRRGLRRRKVGRLGLVVPCSWCPIHLSPRWGNIGYVNIDYSKSSPVSTTFLLGSKKLQKYEIGPRSLGRYRRLLHLQSKESAASPRLRTFPGSPRRLATGDLNAVQRKRRTEDREMPARAPQPWRLTASRPPGLTRGGEAVARRRDGLGTAAGVCIAKAMVTTTNSRALLADAVASVEKAAKGSRVNGSIRVAV